MLLNPGQPPPPEFGSPGLTFTHEAGAVNDVAIAADNATFYSAGSDKTAIERAIRQIHEQNAALTLPVTLERTGDKLTVTVPASENEKGQAEVWLCPTTKAARAKKVVATPWAAST